MRGRPGEVSVQWAARVLGRSRWSMWRWLRADRLLYVRVELGPPAPEGKRRVLRYWLKRSEVEQLRMDLTTDRLPASAASADGALSTVESGPYCDVPGCEKLPAPRHLKCWMHYRRQARGGDMQAPPQEVLPPREKLVAAAIELADAETDEEFDESIRRVVKAAKGMSRRTKSHD